jgi:hypothetical protein
MTCQECEARKLLDDVWALVKESQGNVGWRICEIIKLSVTRAHTVVSEELKHTCGKAES